MCLQHYNSSSWLTKTRKGESEGGRNVGRDEGKYEREGEREGKRKRLADGEGGADMDERRREGR